MAASYSVMKLDVHRICGIFVADTVYFFDLSTKVALQ